MSTRVHELAKELGVKSQELLDRIQEWGFEVKSSIFAGLDPATVEQVRGRYHASEPAGTTAAPVAKPSPRPGSPAPPETPAIRSTLAPERARGPRRRPSGGPRARPAPSPEPKAAPVAAEAPAARRPGPPRPAPPTMAARPAARGRPPHGPADGPAERPDRRPAARQRRRSPLPAYARTAASRAAAPASGQAPAPGVPIRPEPRPNPATLPPLKPSDYISPTGRAARRDAQPEHALARQADRRPRPRG